MKLIFLGSGSAFTVGTDNFQSNMLLMSEQGDKLLIDCGSDVKFSLHKAGFSYLDITDIYISHLHSDHVGGLEYVGLSTKFDPKCHRPKLYLSQDIVSELWERTLSGGMRSIEGEITNLHTFFEVCIIEQNGYFTWRNIEFHLVKVVHVNNGSFVMPSYGLFFEIAGIKVFLTTDTQLRLDEIGDYYKRADIIFQDCEISSSPTCVHARYEQLLTLPKKIRNKMWLYGYQPGHLPDAINDGFRGFVKRGQAFDFSLSPDSKRVESG